MGSLVVWDINRYNDDFKCGSAREHGTTPYGLMGNNAGIDLSAATADVGYRRVTLLGLMMTTKIMILMVE